MMPLALALLLALPGSDPQAETSKPVGVTRDEQKELLEKHKQAKPRLPFPQGTQSGVNNGWFRSNYVPADLRGGTGAGGREGTDPAMTLNNTFKVKLFWITSRANNCYYCLGHQELKLSAAGVSDDDIALLDGNWVDVPARERAAYAFTKKLTHMPHLVTSEDVEALKTHFTPEQVLEILVTVAGYNSTNRWTDGLNIPAEASGAFFKKEGNTADLTTFKSPTSARFATQKTTVAPVRLSPRPKLEARDFVEARWKEKRTALLPLASEAPKELWTEQPVPNWVSVLAPFPKAMKSRIAGIKAGMEKGTLSARLSAEIAWVAARNDRAWYALDIARERLKKTGLTDDEMFALDGDRKQLPEAEQAALALVETLTVSPWRVTDEQVERCRKSFTDGQVGEVFHHACNAAFFDRVTEVAKLPLDR